MRFQTSRLNTKVTCCKQVRETSSKTVFSQLENSVLTFISLFWGNFEQFLTLWHFEPKFENLIRSKRFFRLAHEKEHLSKNLKTKF